MRISEKEIKLLVSSEGGNQVFAELKNTSKIDNFILRTSKHSIIQDSYLDSEAFLLAKNNSYLRVRSKNGAHVITFRHESLKDNQIQIDEVTHPMNDAGVNLAISKLKEFGYIKENPDYSMPFYNEVFQSAGFREMLRLNIKRDESDIYMEDVKIGNIKLDEFFYHYYNPANIFYEIEIDTYRHVFYASVLELSNLLKKQYNRNIEKQSTSKYKRGLSLIYNISIPTLEV